MVSSNGLLRVFWPKDAPRSAVPGVMIGWRNSELDLFVVSILEDVEVKIAPGVSASSSLTRNSLVVLRTPCVLGISFETPLIR